MAEDKEHYNYVIPQEEKNFTRHIRHNTRFITHPYSQQNIVQPLDTGVQNELNQMQHMQNFATINPQSLISSPNVIAQSQDNQNIKNSSNISTRIAAEKNQTQQKSSQEVNSEADTEIISNAEETKSKNSILFRTII